MNFMRCLSLVAKGQDRGLVSPFLDARQGKNSGLKTSQIKHKRKLFFVTKLQQMSAFLKIFLEKKTPSLGMRKETK